MAMKDPDESIGFLVNDVARLLRHDFNRRAGRLGLSQSQSRALAYLSRQEGVRQVTLAETLEIQPMTLARLIDDLEKAGLVSRRRDPDDRRAVRLYLTGGAREHLELMWRIAAETRAVALAGLSDEAVRKAMEVLRQIKRNLLDAENRTEPGTDSEKKTPSNA